MSVESLLILLSYVNPSEQEHADITKLCNLVSNPNELFPLAKKNVVIPWITYQMKRLTPASFQEKINWLPWEEETKLIKQINSQRLQRALPVLQDMHKQKIPIIMLKGIMLAEILYHNSFYKRMNDVDMLIHPQDLDKIYQIFKQHGFFYVGERVGKDLNKQIKVSHHAPPFINPSLDCMFGTQWGLKSPFAKLKIDYPALWRRARPCNFHGLELMAMSPEDNLFHLCIHLGHFKSGLRDVMDLTNLLRENKNSFDWAYFSQTIKSAGAQSLCYHALSLLRAYYETPELVSLIAELRPQTSNYFKSLVARKTRNLDVLLNHSSSYLAEIEKGISEFNLSDNFPQKLRLFFQVWLALLFPPTEEAIRLSCLYRPDTIQTIIAKLIAPYRLIRAIGHEIGNLLLLGLFIKTKLDLLISLKDQIVQKHQGLTMEDKIATYGINREQIARFKSLVQ